jgi:hypothetical protein
MDLSCLGQVEKLYYERNGIFEPDDWKRFVPNRESTDKLKSRLLKERDQDAESSNVSQSNVVSKQQPDDEKGKQPLRSKSA